MNNRTMVKLNACGEILDIQTFSAEKQSPHRFAVLRSDLARLETQHQTSLVSDLYSFAKMWLERMSGQEIFLHIDFTWLSSFGKCGVSGFQERIRVPYACFHAFVIDNDSIDGQSRRLLSIPDTNRPRIAFQRSRNLAAVAGNPLLRHKLGLFLDRHFQWRNCTKIILTDETIPYSFAFQSYTAVGADITGGVILHQQEDLRTAYYSIHT